MSNLTTTLLVTHNAELVNQVQALHDACSNSRLEICGRIDKACQVGQQHGFTLVLVHVASARRGMDAENMLRSFHLKNCTIVPIVLADEIVSPASLAGWRAAHQVLTMPADIERLTQLVKKAHPPVVAPSPTVPAAGPCRVNDSKPNSLSPDDWQQQLQLVAEQDTTVLIVGETGTGKTRLANQIHQLSPRRAEPFLVMDCGALSPTLIESEMFGHVKGAFSGAERTRLGKFAAAGAGTLLLDEVNSLPPPLQSKLLRVVEDRVFEPVGSNKTTTVKARLIAVSNTALENEVQAGRFRADLFYRLNVLTFRLPPLRESRELIPQLVEQFLEESGGKLPRPVEGVSVDALQALVNYDWPGNIRELRNVIERATTLTQNPRLELKDLPEDIRSPSGHGKELVFVNGTAPASPPRDSFVPPQSELNRILSALSKHDNNRLRAAAELGLSRVSLYKKLHKYGLMEKPKPPSDPGPPGQRSQTADSDSIDQSEPGYQSEPRS
jgi:DNA-binding NtrC family response regulator